jgi:hypothetical protein
MHLDTLRVAKVFGGEGKGTQGPENKMDKRPCAPFVYEFLLCVRLELFLAAVVLGVALGRFVGVVHGLGLVALCDLGVVRGLFVIARFVVLGCLLMVLLRVARMFGRARVMLRRLLCHLDLLRFACELPTNHVKRSGVGKNRRSRFSSVSILDCTRRSLNTAKLVIRPSGSSWTQFERE